MINYFWNGREWPYKYVKSRNIPDGYLVLDNSTDGIPASITDYKIHCFKGGQKSS